MSEVTEGTRKGVTATAGSSRSTAALEEVKEKTSASSLELPGALDLCLNKEEKRREEKRREEKRRRASASSLELPGALDLRRLGIDPRSQAKADAEATELQGDGVALA